MMSKPNQVTVNIDQLGAFAAMDSVQALYSRIAETQDHFTDSDYISFLADAADGKSISGLEWLAQFRALERAREYQRKSQSSSATWAEWAVAYSALEKAREIRRKSQGKRLSAPVKTPHPSDPDKKDRQASEIAQLREQVKQLTIQNQLLQTRVVEQAKSVSEQRNSLSRETRNSDKLHAELVAAREQNSKMLELQDRCLTFLNDRARANDSLVCQLAGVVNGTIRMHESYEGQVESVGESTAIVVYNVNGDLVEQTYEKSQFKDGRLPAEGVCVKVLVFVVEYEPQPPSADDLERATSDKPSHRKPLSGPDRL